MLKIDYNKLIEVTQQIQGMQAESDELGSVINSLQLETDKTQEISLTITKSQKCFCLVTSELIALVQSKKTALDAQIKDMLDKISIKP